MPKYLDFVKLIFWLGGWAIIRVVTIVLHTYMQISRVSCTATRISHSHMHTYYSHLPAKAPPQKRKLPDDKVCIGYPGNSYPLPINSKSMLEFSRRV
jgi:hypothetical protein